MRKKTKIVFFTLFLIAILVGSVLQLLYVYGAEAIDIPVSGTNTGGYYEAVLTGDFLGDTINYSEFSFDWGLDEGEIIIHSARGLMTIKLSQAEYDSLSEQFKIKKAVITYPSGYPYTITIDMIIGTADSTDFSGHIIGRYVDAGSSGDDDDDETCEDCCNVKQTNDSVNKVLRIEVRGDKDISSAGVVLYLSDGSTNAGNLSPVSDRLYLTNYPYGAVYPTGFSISVIFSDGGDFTEYYSVYSSSSWSGWSGTTTTSSSDYTTVLNLAKSKGFNTVTELVNDLNSSVKNKQSSITTLQDQLRAKANEYESLKATSDQYKRDSAGWQSDYEQEVQKYNDLDTKYKNLLNNPTQGTTGTTTNSPIDLKIPKEVIGGVLVVAIILVLGKKGKLPRIRNRKKKFNPIEYQEAMKKNGVNTGLPGSDAPMQEDEYIVREEVDEDGRKVVSPKKLWENITKLGEEQKELYEQALKLGYNKEDKQ